jgi:hypothetical protein
MICLFFTTRYELIALLIVLIACELVLIAQRIYHWFDMRRERNKAELKWETMMVKLNKNDPSR